MTTAARLFGPLLARARSADRTTGSDPIALAQVSAGCARRRRCAVAAPAQHHLAVAVGNEIQAPAPGALVMVGGILFDTAGAESFSGAVKVGEVSFFTSTVRKVHGCDDGSNNGCSNADRRERS